MSPQVQAILWAQWRSMRNHRAGKARSGSWVATLITSSWYGVWLIAAVAAGLLAAEDGDIGMSRERFLRATLFLVFLYWQLVPIFMASTGLSLDLRRLIVYPVPHKQLFAIEVLLRVTAAVEMVMILFGIAIGLAFNSKVPWWGPFGVVPFLLFNLFLAAGLRDLLGRFFARKGIREILILGIVLLAASVQLILTSFLVNRPGRIFSMRIGDWWPWTAASSLASGEGSLAHLVVALAWFVAAGLFGHWQFERSLKFDAASAGASSDVRTGISRLERFYRLPSLFLRDPLGVMVEKELRFLSRSPRFRLVFLMGFSFGLLIWLPMALRGPSESGALFGTHFLTAITVYALMLLGEVCFWNTFGFDRKAVQVYFAMPVSFTSVLIAKNIASLMFVFLEAAAITLVCLALRVSISLSMILEAFTVTLVMSVFLLAIGNMLSTRSPKPVDPDQTWRRNAAGKVQAVLLLIYLVVAVPIGLAYLAEYAFDSQFAFYGVLAVDAAIAGIVYYIALESAVHSASARKEEIIAALSYAEGPVG